MSDRVQPVDACSACWGSKHKVAVSVQGHPATIRWTADDQVETAVRGQCGNEVAQQEPVLLSPVARHCAATLDGRPTRVDGGDLPAPAFGGGVHRDRTAAAGTRSSTARVGGRSGGAISTRSSVSGRGTGVSWLTPDTGTGNVRRSGGDRIPATRCVAFELLDPAAYRGTLLSSTMYNQLRSQPITCASSTWIEQRIFGLGLSVAQAYPEHLAGRVFIRRAPRAASCSAPTGIRGQGIEQLVRSTPP